MNIKNKKAQTGILTVIFIVGTFLVVWIMFAGKELARWGNNAVIMNNLTGIEALGFQNLNLLVFFALLLFIFVYGAIKIQ